MTRSGAVVFPARLEETLDFELFLSDASCFIPVDLCEVDAVVFQTNPGDALALSPPTTPVQLAQAFDFAYLGANRKGLDVADLADDGEEHGADGTDDGRAERPDGSGAAFCGPTLSGRQRQDARPGLARMNRVPQGRAWWPAVGAPLEGLAFFG
jgi:hypothetical protein